MNPSNPFVFETAAVFEPAVYHHFYRIAPERTEQEVGFLVAKLGLAAPCRILDLACGHGRHANRLAALGHRVTGVDASRGFLEEARAAAAAMQVACEYREQDMRTLADESAFDLALCLFTAFGYFSDAENAAVVRAVGRALAPGGRFVLDVINRDRLMRHMQAASVTERDEDLMIDRHRFDSATGRCVTRRTYLIAGRRIEAPFSVRLYNLQELAALFASAGMRLEHAWGDWNGSEVGFDHPRLLLVARKEGAG